MTSFLIYHFLFFEACVLFLSLHLFALMKNTQQILFFRYVGLLYRKQKKIFWLFFIFILLNTGLTGLGIEAPPFYQYAMYSTPVVVQDTIHIYTVACDGIPFNEPEYWNHHRRIMFNYTVEYFDRSLQNDSIPVDRSRTEDQLSRYSFPYQNLLDDIYADISDIRGYPSWLKAYMSRLLDKNIRHLEVFKTTAVYEPNGHLRILNQQTLCKS